jgi:hypothetical protein
MSNTWTWLVSFGDFRESVCIERDGERAVRSFLRKHDGHETFKRPAGYHWDGGKL